MSIFKHIWWAIRYGDWSAGWDADWGTTSAEPFLQYQSLYYDGNHRYVRVGKFWFGVTY
jgi:hypothetical protein